MFYAAIEVEFGPHWADIALICVSLLTAATSTAVAVIAHKSGKKAQEISAKSIKIASDANDREVKRLKAEQQSEIDRERADTSLAMIRAVLAKKTYSLTPPRKWVSGSQLAENPRLETARQDSEMLQNEALARTTLFTGDKLLRDWLEHILHHVYAANASPEVGEEEAEAMVARLLFNIGRWGAGAITLQELADSDPDGPLDTAQGGEWCAGRSFR